MDYLLEWGQCYLCILGFCIRWQTKWIPNPWHAKFFHAYIKFTNYNEVLIVRWSCSKFQSDFLYFLYVDWKNNWVTISFFLDLSPRKKTTELTIEWSFEGMSSVTIEIITVIKVLVYSKRYLKIFKNKLTYMKALI